MFWSHKQIRSGTETVQSRTGSKHKSCCCCLFFFFFFFFVVLVRRSSLYTRNSVTIYSYCVILWCCRHFPTRLVSRDIESTGIHPIFPCNTIQLLLAELCPEEFVSGRYHTFWVCFRSISVWKWHCILQASSYSVYTMTSIFSRKRNPPDQL